MPAVRMDSTNAVALNQVFSVLDYTMNTDVHAGAASGAAFAILEKEFGIETDAMAYLNEEEFTHVYEWDQVGRPTGRLFQTVLNGRGRNRSISWEWLPSKTIVPIDPEDYPEDFDTSRLKEHHIFIWKAPIMEYGNIVKVKRKYSKVLVIPYPDAHSDLYDAPGHYYSDGQKEVLITKRSYSFSPGQDAGVVGNFTTWFAAWWGEGRAETILDQIFQPVQNNSFKRQWVKNTKELSGRVNSAKNVSFSISNARMKGTKIAEKIAKGITEDYLEIAKTKGGWSL